MFKYKTCAVLTAVSTVLGLCAPARAGSSISAWVSGSGQDVSGCGSVASPCRSFQYAHDNILGANGGDILVRDSGNYGPLSITKTLSVINDGAGTAGTGAPTGKIAIAINTPGAVLLRGLTIDGVNGANTGIYVAGPGSVTIENCSMVNFSYFGIEFSPSGDVSFSIVNTLVQNNGLGGGFIASSGGGAVRGDIRKAKIVGNLGSGFETDASGSHVTISDTLISRNSYGVYASRENTTVALRSSSITWNSNGYYVAGSALLQTYSDNVIVGNGSNTGTLTPVTPN